MDNSKDNYFSDLIQQIDIIDVFEKLGFKIIKRGSSRPVTLCPFHNDTHPSLVIYGDQYHCYACGAHGNIFSIIKHVKNCSFHEAVNWIEDQFPYIKRSSNIKRAFKETKFETGFEIAYECYKNMDKFEDEKLQKFACDRKYTKDFLIQSEIFYANGNKLISKYSNSLKMQELLLEENLLKEVAEPDIKNKYSIESNYKDIFNKDRAIITLRNYNNNIVGFAGRAVPDDKNQEAKPKYLFTKGFQKSKMLYRLNAVKEKAIREENKKYFEIYITEGTFDALRLESLQFNAVSVLGSHITSEQVRVLSEFVSSINSQYETIMIHIFMDTDSAGIEGAFKSIKNLWSNEIIRMTYIDIIVNKKNLDSQNIEKKLKDPDEIGKNDNLNDNWIKNNTLKIFEFLMRYLCDKENLMLEDKNLNFERYYSDLDIRIKISLLNKLKNLFPYKYWKQVILFYSALNGNEIKLTSDYFEFNIFNQFIFTMDIPNSKSEHKEENKSDLQLINSAVKIARNSYVKDDVPIDDFTWDRIEKCASIFNIFLREKLKELANLDMPMLAMNVPKKRSEYRLKAMYSHEQLIMQQYILNELLRSNELGDVDFERFVPAVRYDNNLVYTTGWNYNKSFDDIKEKSVSFAYQIDMSVMNGQYIGNKSMFRPYYECWKSFINYVSEGITKMHKEKVYKVRLDVSVKEFPPTFNL